MKNRRAVSDVRRTPEPQSGSEQCGQSHVLRKTVVPPVLGDTQCLLGAGFQPLCSCRAVEMERVPDTRCSLSRICCMSTQREGDGNDDGGVKAETSEEHALHRDPHTRVMNTCQTLRVE